ncbi:MAG: hypothetical protein ACE5EQ_04435 [Phycisphaerae bacterium]
MRFIGTRSATQTGLWVLAVWLLGSNPGLLHAGDVLRKVPADVAGVIRIHNLKEINDRLGGFIRQFQPKYDGYDPDEFEVTIGQTPGTVDTTREIHIIFLRSESVPTFLMSDSMVDARKPYPVIAFHPKPTSDLSKSAGEGGSRIRRRQGPFGSYYLLVHDGVAFVCNKKKPLRDILQVQPEASLATSLCEDEKSIFAHNDLAVHIPLSRWRESIKTYTLLLTNIIRFGIAAQIDPQQMDKTQAVMDWLINGVREGMDQMQSFTIALNFDGETFRVDHYHTFESNGWVSGYLNKITRSDIDLWSGFPDQPFLLLGSINWRCPAENSFTCRMTRMLMNTDSIRKSISPAKREKLLDYMDGYISKIKCNEFMLTSPPGKSHPIRVLGLICAEDASSFMKEYSYIQKQSSKLITAFMPGCSSLGMKIKKTSQDGIPCMEMKLTGGDMSDVMCQQIALVYGADARVQQAAISNHQVAYVMGEPPFNVTCLSNTFKSGKHIGKNPAIRRIERRLCKKPNIIVIGDVSGLMGSFIPMQRAAIGWTAAKGQTVIGEASQSEIHLAKSALFGWSCRVRPNALQGRWVMSASDMREVIQQTNTLFEHTETSYDHETNGEAKPDD